MVPSAGLVNEDGCSSLNAEPTENHKMKKEKKKI